MDAHGVPRLGLLKQFIPLAKRNGLGGAVRTVGNCRVPCADLAKQQIHGAKRLRHLASSLKCCSCCLHYSRHCRWCKRLNASLPVPAPLCLSLTANERREGAPS